MFDDNYKCFSVPFSTTRLRNEVKRPFGIKYEDKIN